MTLSNAIEPINGTHSIVEAICVIVLVNPLIDLQRFKRLVADGALAGEFQSFRLKPTRNFSVSLDATLVPQTTITEPVDTGFSIESFNGGDLEWLVSYDANLPMATISLHNYNYMGWHSFREKTVRVLQTLTTVDVSMYTNTIWLAYKDQFTWLSDTTVDLRNDLFKPNPFVPDVLCQDVNDWQFTLSRNVQHDGIILGEQITTSLGSLSDRKRGITVQHNLGYPSNPIALDSIGIAMLVERLDTIHDFNKNLLRQCLQDDMLERIGIAKTA